MRKTPVDQYGMGCSCCRHGAGAHAPSKTDGAVSGMLFRSQRTQGLYMRADAHGERARKVYALDYCAASFVTEGEFRT